MPEPQETPAGDNGIVPPPLFSPHVYIEDKHERRTFESGYDIEFSRFMVAYYVELYPVLLMAKKYNIPVMWKRILEIEVHEAWALKPQVGFSIHDVRCKLTIGEETGRTEFVNPNIERKLVWNQSFRFHVADPCDIVLLAYCKNSLLPNDKLGRLWIQPNQLIEGKAITEWFSFNTSGEIFDIWQSITLSQPEPMPFKFSFSRIMGVSSRDGHVFSANNEKVFTMIGKWPYSVSLLDGRSNSVLSIHI